MSGIRFTLREAPAQRLDLSVLTPDRLKHLDLAAILRSEVGSTRHALELGEAFSVQDGDRGQIVIAGGSDRFDFIGRDMTEGEILVDGDAGVQAGRQMTGGRLSIRGNAGDLVGSAMRGGTIEIGGDAGDFLGGAFAGERTGMRGGSIVVRGRAGSQAANRLRRGLIIVEGNAGAYAGGRMVAGTLIVCGVADALPGYLMRRGTIVTRHAPDRSPSFVPTAAVELVFTELLARAVRPFSNAAEDAVRAARRRFVGDLAVMGKGELFTSE